MELIRYENVSIRYEPGKPVVRGVNLSMEAGSITVFLGPNGSGKTTLTSALNGLIRPYEGRVLVDGKDVFSMKRRELGRQIACVPQFSVSSFSYTVYDMVLWGRSPYIAYKPGEEDHRLVQQVLEQFQISHLAQKSFNSISGGEKQMAMIARSIVQQAPVVIMDEPATYLDLKNQIRILNLIRTVRDSQGTTFVITLHDPNHAIYLADNIVMVHDGSAQIGRKEDMINREKMEALYHIRVSFHEENGMKYMLPDFRGAEKTKK